MASDDSDGFQAPFLPEGHVRIKQEQRDDSDKHLLSGNPQVGPDQGPSDSPALQRPIEGNALQLGWLDQQAPHAYAQPEAPVPPNLTADQPGRGHDNYVGDAPFQPQEYQPQGRPLIVPSQAPVYADNRAEGYTGDRHAGPGPVRRDRRAHGQGPAAVARDNRQRTRSAGRAAGQSLPYGPPPFVFQGGYEGPSPVGYFPHGQLGGDRARSYLPRPFLSPASCDPTVTQAGPSNVRRLPLPPAFNSAPPPTLLPYGGAPQGQVHPAPTHAYGFAQTGPSVQSFPSAGNPPLAPQGSVAGPSAPHPGPAASFSHGLPPNPAPAVQPQPGPSTTAAGPSAALPANGYECAVCHTYFDDRAACGLHALDDHILERFREAVLNTAAFILTVPRRQT